jgi:hypothetical protein
MGWRNKYSIYCAYLGLQEAFTKKHREAYNFHIGHNAHHRTEQCFQRGKQLCSTRVLWVHRHKYSHLWIQGNFLTFKLEEMSYTE